MLPYRVLRLVGRVINRSLRAMGVTGAADAFVRWAQQVKVVAKFHELACDRKGEARVCVLPDLARLDKLKREFAALFPERPDQLSFSDFVPYLGVMAPLREVFNKYDVILKLIRQTRSSVDLR